MGTTRYFIIDTAGRFFAGHSEFTGQRRWTYDHNDAVWYTTHQQAELARALCGAYRVEEL